MARLAWDAPGERYFQVGVDKGVLYIPGRPGVAWNGLTAITEHPAGGDIKSYYLDGVKYAQVSSVEDFAGTIEAYTYPDAFNQCDGYATIYSGLFATNQRRKPFNLSYQTKIGNDIDGVDYAYRLHLLYNVLAQPTERKNASIDDSSNPATFSWDISALPPAINGFKRTAHFVIDSRSTPALTLSNLEDILYGTDALTASLPTVDELLAIFLANSTFHVIDNGDGSWTATGTDDEVFMTGTDTFEIDSLGATIVDSDTYTLSSP